MPPAGAAPACLSATLDSEQAASRELPVARGNSPHACPQAPNRKVLARICELGAAHGLRAVGRIVRSEKVGAWPHEAQTVKDVRTGIIGVIVQDVVDGDARDLASRNVRAVLGEGMRAQRFAPESHCSTRVREHLGIWGGTLTFV